MIQAVLARDSLGHADSPPKQADDLARGARAALSHRSYLLGGLLRGLGTLDGHQSTLNQELGDAFRKQFIPARIRVPSIEK